MRWTEEMVAVLRNGYGKIHIGRLSETLGMSRSAIQQKAFKLGLKGTDPNRVCLDQNQTYWLKRNFPHVSNSVCAMILGCSIRTVVRRARELGLSKTALYMAESQALASRKAMESHTRNGTYPPKGFAVPRREEFYFKKKHDLKQAIKL